MDIAKAIIAGIATILSALITIVLKEYFDRKKEGDKYEHLEKPIREAIIGKWKGHFEQTRNDQHLIFDLTLDLNVSSSGLIKGKANIVYQGENYDLNVHGGFYSQRFLKMDYENSNRAILQFGSFVLKLEDDAQMLTGNFVGYGHKSRKIIAGNSVLYKV